MSFVARNLCVSVLKDPTQSQLCNCSIINTGNAAEHACPDSKSWQPHHRTAKP